MRKRPIRKPRGARESEEEARTDEDGGLTDRGDPGVCDGVGVIPPAQVVVLQHADCGEEKAEKPEEGAGVAEAEIELEKCRQQKHRKDERGKVVAVGHGSARISTDNRVAKGSVTPRTRRQNQMFPGGGSRSLMSELNPLMPRGKWRVKGTLGNPPEERVHVAPDTRNDSFTNGRFCSHLGRLYIRLMW